MKKRIFIAILTSDKLKRKILEFRSKYQDLPVRWTEEKNLHLTLIPPFYANETELNEVIENLNKIEGQIGENVIKFNKISLGPKQKRLNLLWAEGEPSIELNELKNKIARVLGLDNEKREFIPHLTLARFKIKIDNFRIVPIDWTETAKSFSIIESKLTPEAALYSIMKEIKL